MTEVQFTIGLIFITFFVGAVVEIILISWAIGWLLARSKLLLLLVALWFWLLWVPFTVHTEAPQDIYRLLQWYW